MMSHTLGEGGSAKSWHSSISLFSKMGDEEGGIKNLKKWVTSFMDGGPKTTKYLKLISITY